MAYGCLALKTGCLTFSSTVLLMLTTGLKWSQTDLSYSGRREKIHKYLRREIECWTNSPSWERFFCPVRQLVQLHALVRMLMRERERERVRKRVCVRERERRGVVLEDRRAWKNKFILLPVKPPLKHPFWKSFQQEMGFFSFLSRPNQFSSFTWLSFLV